LNVVRNRPAAKWLPSRHRFALARLIAYVMLRTRRPSLPQVDRIVLAIDRDQSAIENHAVSAWFLGSTICFIAAALPFSVPVALLLAFPLALIAVEIPLHVTGLLSRDRWADHTRASSVATMLSGVVAASYFAMRPGWAQPVGRLFLAIVIANGVAALIMWLLRDHVRKIEERCAA
jgi:hypothetical protein